MIWFWTFVAALCSTLLVNPVILVRMAQRRLREDVGEDEMKTFILYQVENFCLILLTGVFVFNFITNEQLPYIVIIMIVGGFGQLFNSWIATSLFRKMLVTIFTVMFSFVIWGFFLFGGTAVLKNYEENYILEMENKTREYLGDDWFVLGEGQEYTVIGTDSPYFLYEHELQQIAKNAMPNKVFGEKWYFTKDDEGNIWFATQYGELDKYGPDDMQGIIKFNSSCSYMIQKITWE